MDIFFKKPFNLEKEEYVVLKTNTALLDRLWTNGFRIKPIDSDNPKYINAFNYIKENKSCAMPYVSYNEDMSIGFKDGRHRFAVLRDLGITEIEIAVDIKDINIMKQILGVI